MDSGAIHRRNIKSRRGHDESVLKKKSSARKCDHIIGRRNGGIRLSVRVAYFHEADSRPPHAKSLCKPEWGTREIDELTWEGLGSLLPREIPAERVTVNSTRIL